MTQYAKVVALTTNPSFLDLYGTKGGALNDPYNPAAAGEEGYMELGAAQTARSIGDVLIHVEEQPLRIDWRKNGRVAIKVGADPAPGTPDVAADIIVSGGPSGGNATVTVRTAIDGGAVDLQQVAVASNDTSDDVAAAIAALTIPGITPSAVGSVVTLTPGAGTAITTLTANIVY